MKLKIKKEVLTGILIFFISSCTYTSKNSIIDSKLLEGEWTTGKYPYQDLRFENGKFYDSNEVNKEYSFKISSDSLIITNEEKERKLFKIIKLNKDSLTLRVIPQKTVIIHNNKRFPKEEERVYHKMTVQELYNKYLNSVKGHIEKDTIIGNFTGLGMDTLYVCMEENFPQELEQPYSLEDFLEYQHYYARSNNPDIPDVEIFGMPYGAPQLVFEGDLDGDGKDEWGFLPVWMNSQWRTYRVYNYDENKKGWRHLYYDLPDTNYNRPHILSMPEYIRASGVDIVEKGPKPGLIKIHYGEYDGIVYDTIVKPNYIPITEETF